MVRAAFCATSFISALVLVLSANSDVAAEVRTRVHGAAIPGESIDHAHVPLKTARPAGKPYDKPMQAAKFHAWQRSKDPAFDTAAAWRRAYDEARGLPVFSSAANRQQAESDPGVSSALDSWTPLGPGNVGGRTRAFAFHPNFTTNNTIFVGGVAGGIWRSTDGGSSWTPLGDFNPNLAVTVIVFDRTNANRLWAGTGEGYFNADGVRGSGIFESTDGGLSWNQIQSTNPVTGATNFRYVMDIVQSPNVDGTWYVTTLTGLWRTTDSGANWTRLIDATAGTSANGCHDIVARTDVGPNDTLLVSCGNFAPTGTNTGVWRSVDANVATPTFTKRLGPGGASLALTLMGRASLAIAKSNQATVYALVACSGAGCGNFDDGVLGVYRSIDGGATWTERSSSLSGGSPASVHRYLLTNPYAARCFSSTVFIGQGWYDNVIAVDPVNANRVWVGGIDLFRSDNGGTDWGLASYWWLDPSNATYGDRYVHADQHMIAFHPAYDGVAENRLYIGNDGGLYRTSTPNATLGTSICPSTVGALATVSWSNLNNGYQVTQFYHGTVFPNGQNYFGGTQDNGTNIRREGTQSQNQWAEIYGGDGGYVAVDPTNTNVIYAETTDISIVKSTDGGVNWVDGVPGVTDPGGLFINPFLMDPNNSARLFTSGRSIWRTANSAATWTQASSALGTRTCSFGAANDNYSAYAVAPGDSTLMVMGTDLGRLCRLTNATTSTSATTPVCLQPSGTSCYTISSIAFDTAQPTSTPQNSRIVYATVSDFGFSHVLKSVDGGQNWTAIDNQGGTTARLPDIPAHTIVSDPAYPPGQRLYVGTDLGVFVTIDGGLNWMRENAGFANTPVEWLVLHNRQVGTGAVEGKRAKAPATGELFAFTHGRSAFKTSLRAAGGFCSSPGAAIPDNDPTGVSSTITLSDIAAGQTGWIDLDLQLTTTHGRIGDLSATLTRTSGPGGTPSVTLFDRPGVPGTAFCTGSGDNIAATFDDDADYTAETRCVDAATPSLAGAFRPQGFMSTVTTPGTATYRLTITDQAGDETGTLVSWCLVPTANTDATVPVTLGHVAATRVDANQVDIRFETGASVSVAGFEVSASRSARDVFARVPAEADAVTASSYRVTASFPGSQFWLRVLNVDGSVDTKGPFTVGVPRGQPVAAAASIEWAPVRAERAAEQSARLRQSAGRGAGAVPAVNLLVRRDGIQSIGYDVLASSGASGFEGVPVAELALSLRDVAVPIHVVSADAVFGPGDHIEFIGKAVHRPGELAEGFESLYTDGLPYRLARDPARALRMARAATQDFAAPVVSRAGQDQTLEDNRIYAYGSPLRDPWAWDRTLAFAGAPAETSVTFALPGIDTTRAARIDVTLHGGNDFPAGGNDHEAVVSLNGQVLGTAVFDGLTAYVVSANLAPGMLSASNTLSVRLPASHGQIYDLVYLEDVRVRFERDLFAATGALSFVATEGSGTPIAVAEGSLLADGFETPAATCTEQACRTFSVTGLQAGSARVYQGVGDDWYRIEPTEEGGSLRFTIPVSSGHRFEIADARGVHVPEVAPIADVSGLQAGPAEYLVISHPQFAGALGDLLARRQADGLSTKLVTTDALYQAYAFGQVDPQAIEDYIGFARANLGARYVLLVGGDTYDYFDDLGLGSVSHVPTRYRAGDAFVRFAASDNEYADVDNDRVPDVALGRLPVRTVAELEGMLATMQAFAASSAQRQVFSADASGEGIDFDAYVDEQRQGFSGGAPQVTAYMDTAGTSAARTALVDGVQAGARYLGFFGHSSPDRWSYAPLLTAADLESGLLANPGAPVFVNQLGCWNTFFLSPQANGMAHAWLRPSGGAVAVLGATALTEVASGHEFGKRIAERLVPGVRIGDVVREAKADLAADGVPAHDILVLTTLLGDPALRY